MVVLQLPLRQKRSPLRGEVDEGLVDALGDPHSSRLLALRYGYEKKQPEIRYSKPATRGKAGQGGVSLGVWLVCRSLEPGDKKHYFFNSSAYYMPGDEVRFDTSFIWWY